MRLEDWAAFSATPAWATSEPENYPRMLLTGQRTHPDATRPNLWSSGRMVADPDITPFSSSVRIDCDLPRTGTGGELHGLAVPFERCVRMANPVLESAHCFMRLCVFGVSL
jgi:hypothetical protein